MLSVRTMAERTSQPAAAPKDDDGLDADDTSPTIEVVEGDDVEDAVVGHAPTSQGLGFDPVGFLAGLATEETKPTPSRADAPPPSTRVLGSRPPEQARQTLPTLSPSHRTHVPDRSVTSRIPTPKFGDLASALAEAEAALTDAPNDLEAQRLMRALRTRLELAHEERLAPLSRVVVPIVGASLEGLADDAQYLAERIDGRSTIAELVESSGMTRLDALRGLAQLAELGIALFR
jgi:hypothetical protein